VRQGAWFLKRPPRWGPPLAVSGRASPRLRRRAALPRRFGETGRSADLLGVVSISREGHGEVISGTINKCYPPLPDTCILPRALGICGLRESVNQALANPSQGADNAARIFIGARLAGSG